MSQLKTMYDLAAQSGQDISLFLTEQVYGYRPGPGEMPWHKSPADHLADVVQQILGVEIEPAVLHPEKYGSHNVEELTRLHERAEQIALMFGEHATAFNTARRAVCYESDETYEVAHRLFMAEYAAATDKGVITEFLIEAIRKETRL